MSSRRQTPASCCCVLQEDRSAAAIGTHIPCPSRPSRPSRTHHHVATTPPSSAATRPSQTAPVAQMTARPTRQMLTLLLDRKHMMASHRTRPQERLVLHVCSCNSNSSTSMNTLYSCNQSFICDRCVLSSASALSSLTFFHVYGPSL